MYKLDLALNNLQWLICHKTKPKLFYLYCKTHGPCHTYRHIHHPVSWSIEYTYSITLQRAKSPPPKKKGGGVLSMTLNWMLW